MSADLGASLPGDEHIHNLRASTPLLGISGPSQGLELTVPNGTAALE